MVKIIRSFLIGAAVVLTAAPAFCSSAARICSDSSYKLEALKHCSSAARICKDTPDELEAFKQEIETLENDRQSYRSGLIELFESSPFYLGIWGEIFLQEPEKTLDSEGVTTLKWSYTWTRIVFNDQVFQVDEQSCDVMISKSLTDVFVVKLNNKNEVISYEVIEEE